MAVTTDTSLVEVERDPVAIEGGPRRPPQRGQLNLHFQQLAYLVELERSPTLTEAARRLGVSQPALSQAVSELERRLGVALLERTGRLRRMTEAGRELTRFASEVLGRASQMEDWLAAHREGDAGGLRVGMIDAAGLYVLPETIRAFRAARPAVRLSVTVESSTVLLAALARFALDLAFVIGPVDEEFEAHELLREPLYLYGPDRAGAQLPATATDFAAEQWALYPAGSQTRALIDGGLARMGLRPNVTLESGNPQILRQLVALGLGWSVLPPGVAEAAEPLLRRASEQPVAERTLFAASRRGAPPNPRAQAFLALAARTVVPPLPAAEPSSAAQR